MGVVPPFMTLFPKALMSPLLLSIFSKRVIQAEGEWGGTRLRLLWEECQRIGGRAQVTTSTLRHEE